MRSFAAESRACRFGATNAGYRSTPRVTIAQCPIGWGRMKVIVPRGVALSMTIFLGELSFNPYNNMAKLPYDN